MGKGFCKFREDEIFKVFLLTSRFISERQFERAKFLSRPTLVRSALLIQHSNFLFFIKCHKPAAVIYFYGFVFNFLCDISLNNNFNRHIFSFQLVLCVLLVHCHCWYVGLVELVVWSRALLNYLFSIVLKSCFRRFTKVRQRIIDRLLVSCEFNILFLLIAKLRCLFESDFASARNAAKSFARFEESFSKVYHPCRIFPLLLLLPFAFIKFFILVGFLLSFLLIQPTTHPSLIPQSIYNSSHFR